MDAQENESEASASTASFCFDSRLYVTVRVALTRETRKTPPKPKEGLDRAPDGSIVSGTFLANQGETYAIP